MKSAQLFIPSLSQVELMLSYVDIAGFSSLNVNLSHIHKECEIYVNLSGDVSFEVENRLYPVSRGSVIITRPYEYHHCICHSDRAHRHYWITFTANEKDELFGLFFGRKKGERNRILLDEAQLERCCEILEGLIENEGDPLARHIGFLQLLRLLQGAKGESRETPYKKIPADVRLALQYMDEHLATELDVKTLAGTVGVSVNTLERHFKEALGRSPLAILRKKRLVSSLESLRNGDTVTEAALQCGISDYSNYIQLFKKQFGLTPLQYKKKFEVR